MHSFDYTPLSSNVSYHDRMQHKSALIVKICGGLAVVFLISSAIPFVLYGEPTGGFGFVIAALISAGLAAAFYYSIGRSVQLERFAQTNGLTFSAMDKDGEARQGRLFERGHSRYFSDIMSSTRHSFDEIGTFNYTTGGGKNRQTHTRGYVRIKLPRRLPHMILDAKSNNFLGKISNIDGIGGQKLNLEGDFDNYFTLYAPPEYATDALYVFTPDIMQLLIDTAHKYDCEIIDDNFYLHASTPFDITKPATYEEVLKITDALAAKLDRRTDYYADERVGDRQLNIVAPQGARLKSGVSVATIIMFVSIAIYILFVFISS